MGKGSDVVGIHLLALHVISIADGHCIMQSTVITFFQSPLREHGKIFLSMYIIWPKRGQRVNSAKTLLSHIIKDTNEQPDFWMKCCYLFWDETCYYLFWDMRGGFYSFHNKFCALAKPQRIFWLLQVMEPHGSELREQLAKCSSEIRAS